MVAESQQVVESALLNKAVNALLKYHQTKASSEKKSLLLGDEQAIHVQFNLVRIPEKTSLSSKPIRIEVPHSLHKLNSVEDDDEDNDKLEEAEVCIIVKDSSKEWVQTLISQFPKEMSYIKKVLSLTSLRKKYSQYQDRRTLCNTYSLFLVDDSILPMVGKLLGKSFFMKKKQPVPVKLSRKESLPFAIEKCIKSTFMTIGAGTCLSVRAAFTSMTSDNIQENIQSVIQNVIPHIPRKVSNISSISVKTDSSTALPIYNKVREELESIEKLAKVGGGNSNSKKQKAINDDDDDKNERKKQKKAAASMKSPLLKALKQKKKNDAINEKKEVVDEQRDLNVVKEAKEGENIQKKKKRKASITDDDTDKNAKNNSETKKSNELSKKKIKNTVDDSSSDFIASKKYQGSKKGYVFRYGSKGVGYYTDIKPVPDKAALAALLRVKQQRGGSKSQSQSPRKVSRKGNRKGRRSY